MEYQIIRQGEEEYIEYTVDADTELDRVAQGMLSNNTISGLLPLSMVEKDGRTEYCYLITGLQKFSDIYGKTIYKKGLLSLMVSIVEAIIKARDFMILEETIEFDPDKIFCDFTSGRASLLCVPFKRDEGEIYTLTSAFLEILEKCTVAKNESSAYVSFLTDFLKTEERTADQIRDMLVKVINNEIHIPERALVRKHAGTKEDGAGIQSLEARKNPAEQGKGNRIKTLAFLKESRKEECRASRSIHTSGKVPSGIKTIEQLIAEKTGTAVSAAQPLSPLKEERKNSAFHFSAEEEMEEVYEETGLLEDYQKEKKAPEEKKPYLIRISNQEKIPVTSREFVIGRSEDQSDYAILDNKWISNVHCSIIWTKEGCYVRDLGSMNHTYLNDEMIPSRREAYIPDNAIIRLSNERFRFRYE